MAVPQFRTALYAAILLAFVCFLSPFREGWGRSPSMFILFLSFVYFLMIGIAGVRTIQAWHTARSALRRPVMLLCVAMLAGTVFLILDNPHINGGYPSIRHMKWIIYEFGALAGFVLLMTVQRWRWIVKQRAEKEAAAHDVETPTDES